MRKEIVIKSTVDSTRLIMSQPKRTDAGELEYFTVTVEGPQFRGTTSTYACYGHSITELFNSIASDWKGWEGSREAGTIEADLRLAATNDRRGHTFLDVKLKPVDGHWHLGAALVLETAQLDDIAAEVAKFMADY